MVCYFMLHSYKQKSHMNVFSVILCREMDRELRHLTAGIGQLDVSGSRGNVNGVSRGRSAM